MQKQKQSFQEKIAQEIVDIEQKATTRRLKVAKERQDKVTRYHSSLSHLVVIFVYCLYYLLFYIISYY